MTDQALVLQIARRLEQEQLKRLEILSLAEATTLVVLVCIAVPLKHAFGWPLGSKIFGPVHGIAFIAYTWTALQTVAGGGWWWLAKPRCCEAISCRFSALCRVFQYSLAAAKSPGT